MKSRIVVAALFAVAAARGADDVDPKVLAAEAKRVAAIEKVRPAVVAIFAPGGQGGGSGVLIDADGYALTNWHVVAGPGPAGANPHMKCGLSNGVLYDCVLVGLDKVGDVALIKLLPQKDGDKFSFAALGDSDKVRAGDWSMAMGNPFLLATDFTPTVTFGLVSGTRRYQHPEGRGLLEYTDCIQVDTSINPGNSGGPLFNMDGELIGINGRISLEKRGRVNVGVGYAISINQIKNFLGHLKAGIDTDHASTGFLVQERSEAGAPKMTVTTILEECDARRRGVEPGAEVLSFAGRPLGEGGVNGYKNVLGIYPRGWRLPLVYRFENDRREVLIRLMGTMKRELDEEGGTKPGQPTPGKPSGGGVAPLPANVAKLYEWKAGFSNFHFNKMERDRLLKAFRAHGDFTGRTGEWVLAGSGEVKGKKTSVKFVIREEKGTDGKEVRTVVRFSLGGVELYDLDPLKGGQSTNELRNPPGSGGVLVALFQYRQMLALGEKGFGSDFAHGGAEPFYLPTPEGQKPDFVKQRVDAEVINTRLAAVPAKWYFSRADGRLLGAEVSLLEREDDPCELYFSDYKKVDGRMTPHTIEVRYGKERYALLNVETFTAGAK